MEVIVSTRHGSVEPEMKEYVQDKMSGIVMGRPLKVTSARVVLDIQKNRYEVEVIVNMKNHDFESREVAFGLTEAIDSAIEKIDTQISRYLDKVQDHKGVQPMAQAIEATKEDLEEDLEGEPLEE